VPSAGRSGTVLLVGLLAAAGLLAACGSPTPSGAAPDASAVAVGITEDGLREHLDAIAAVSGAANGFRATGSAGYDAAADYVTDTLTDAGWTVTHDSFTTSVFADPGGSELVVGGRSFGANDIRPLMFAPAGDVTGPVVALDWDPDARGPGTLGCASADYGDLAEGAIVLVRSGPCRRRDQVLAAQAAGASGFIAAYPRSLGGDVLRPTLFEPAGLEIPAVGATRPVGAALAEAAASGMAVHLVTRATTVEATVRSLIADLEGTEPGAVVMLGAHLDSVVDGPGSNDNASGVAGLLAIAQALGGSRSPATVRLAFWAAEETGLQGSSHYVKGLTEVQREDLVVYLNADMIASPDGFAGVYAESGAVSGSDEVHDLLAEAIREAGGQPQEIDLGGGSDHHAFAQAGIATGGVFAGATETGPDGTVADPCYHQACDDGSDLDLELARILTAALGDAAVRLATQGGWDRVR
jgi:Zn-dependent M28 family amino/carboxypeptidase